MSRGVGRDQVTVRDICYSSTEMDEGKGKGKTIMAVRMARVQRVGNFISFTCKSLQLRCFLLRILSRNASKADREDVPGVQSVDNRCLSASAGASHSSRHRAGQVICVSVSVSLSLGDSAPLS